jgi:hypothetical protein
MKQLSLFILAAAALTSCTTKPWMVGSVNDQKKPPSVPGGVWVTEAGLVAGDDGSGVGADPGAGSGYGSAISSKNPVNVNP